jgi:hypothetical protein
MGELIKIDEYLAKDNKRLRARIAELALQIDLLQSEKEIYSDDKR